MQNQIIYFIWQLPKSTFQHIRDLLKIRMAAKVIIDHFSVEQINDW